MYLDIQKNWQYASRFVNGKCEEKWFRGYNCKPKREWDSVTSKIGETLWRNRTSSLRPSAPVCCCHRDSLARGRLAFAQEAVRGPPPLSPRLVLHVMACAQWFQAASEKCLFKRWWNLKALQLRKLFLGSPTFQVSAPFSTTYSGYAYARSKRTTYCCVECLPPLWITIRRTSSRLFRCVVFVCASLYFPFNHLHTLWHPLSHDRLGMPMEALLDLGRILIQEGLSERSNSESQGDVIPETP